MIMSPKQYQTLQTLNENLEKLLGQEVFRILNTF